MNWEQLKDHCYYQDGSLRDVYVQDTTRKDWRSVIDYLNKIYIVDFEVEDLPRENKINWITIEGYWDGVLNKSISASISIQDIIIKTYFFADTEIEFDIVPSEVNSIEKHNALMNFFEQLSLLLERPIMLTEESYGGYKNVLVQVEGKQIKFM